MSSSDWRETAFVDWTNEQAARIPRDCQQARVAVLQHTYELFDAMRTAYPLSNIWGRPSHAQVRRAILGLLAPIDALTEDMLRTAAQAPEPAKAAEKPEEEEEELPKEPQPRLRVALGDDKDVTEGGDEETPAQQLEEAVLSLYKLLLVDEAEKDERKRADAHIGGPLSSGSEALFLLHDVSMAQMERHLALWAHEASMHERRDMLDSPQGRPFDFEEASGLNRDPTDPKAQAKRKALLEAYTNKVDDTSFLSPPQQGKRAAATNIHFLTEALQFNALPTGTLLRAAEDVSLSDAQWRPQNTPALNRPVPPPYFAEHATDLLRECLLCWDTQLPADIPEPLRGASLGRRLRLFRLVLGTGLMPATLAAAAAGRLPWVIDGPPALDTTTLSEWQAAFEREPERHLRVTDQMRTEAALRKPLAADQLLGLPAPRAGHDRDDNADFAKVAARLRKPQRLPPLGTVMPRRGLAPPSERTARLSGEVEAMAEDEFEGAPEVRAYLDTLDTACSAADLLKLYVQLPLLEALEQRASAASERRVTERRAYDQRRDFLQTRQTVEDEYRLDALVLKEVLSLVLLVDVLVAALGQFTSLALLPAKLATEQEGVAQLNTTDLSLFSRLYERHVALVQRDLPDYLQNMLTSVGQLLQCGSYGPIDWQRDAARAASIVPWIRTVTVRLDLLVVRVRVNVLRHLMEEYLTEWRRNRAVGSVYMQAWWRPMLEVTTLGQFNLILDDKALVRRALPRLFEHAVQPIVAQTLGHLTVGVALWANLLVVTGLQLSWRDLRCFVTQHALQGGLSRHALQGLMTVAAHYAEGARLGAPTLPRSEFDACVAMANLILPPQSQKKVTADRQKQIAYNLERLELGSASTPLRRLMQTLARALVAEGGFQAAVFDPKVLAPSLFFNARLLKYALRLHMLRLGLLDTVA